jgi:hypothetical protein
VLRYHLGTAAFGSLILAIIKTIRSILAYLQRKAKKSGNKIAQYVLCVLQCCMWCLEKCMRFLNKNAYIQTAMHGYSFCHACRAAFFLIARNILRVFAVSVVGDFVLLLGRICIPVITTFLCYIAIIYNTDNQIYGILAPMLMTFVIAYLVTTLFVEVFGMAISTILMCYCADEEMFQPEDRFADGALRGAIKNTQAAATNSKSSSNVNIIQVNAKVSPPVPPAIIFLLTLVFLCYSLGCSARYREGGAASLIHLI